MIVETSDPSLATGRAHLAEGVIAATPEPPRLSLPANHPGWGGFHRACTRKEDKKPGNTEMLRSLLGHFAVQRVVSATASAVTQQHKLDLIRKWSNFSFASCAASNVEVLLVRGPHDWGFLETVQCQRNYQFDQKRFFFL